MKKKILLSLAVFIAATSMSFGQGSTFVDWFNGAGTLLRDAGGTALLQGAPGANNDGALVQLGYYSAATAANNFAGSWIPLTGFGVAPRTTIGDSPDLSGLGAGRIGMSTAFDFGTNVVRVYEPLAGDTGAYLTGSSVAISGTTPPSGQILSIRFFDTNTGTTGNYNAVSADNWTWSSPTEAGSFVTINLNTAALTWESFDIFGIAHAVGDFRTVIAIPEPSTYALLAVGALGFVGMLRRRAKS